MSPLERVRLHSDDGGDRAQRAVVTSLVSASKDMVECTGGREASYGPFEASKIDRDGISDTVEEGKVHELKVGLAAGVGIMPLIGRVRWSSSAKLDND